MRHGDGIKQGVKAAVPGAKARELAVGVRFFFFFFLEAGCNSFIFVW